jgi:hypothetical protein
VLLGGVAVRVEMSYDTHTGRHAIPSAAKEAIQLLWIS